MTRKVIFLERQVPVEDGEYYSHYISPYGDKLDTVELLFERGMHLMHNKMMPSEPGTIHIQSENQYVQFIFVLESPRIYRLDDRAPLRVEIPELHQMAFFIGGDTGFSFSWDQVSMHDIFEINMCVEYLMERLPEKHFLIPRLLQAMQVGRSACLFDQPIPIGTKLKALLYDIHYCKLEGLAKSMFIEAKLLEMFALQQAKFDRPPVDPEVIPSLLPTEKQRMFAVRDYLIANPDSSVSLKELSRMFGTNDCYLKQHFKRTFGTTVYGYIKQLRMEKARKLLLQDNKRISEVARIVGYKHANHFTNAFKKYYGYTPNTLL